MAIPKMGKRVGSSSGTVGGRRWISGRGQEFGWAVMKISGKPQILNRARDGGFWGRGARRRD